jgi:transaldolase
MKLFLDTAVIDEIRTVHSWGVLDGVTTNPTLFARAGGGTYPDVLREIAGITSGPVSAEVVADDLEGMLREGRAFAQIAPNIVVKVPMSEIGLTAISTFAEEGIKTNCTLIFSSAQGLLAAKAGASYLSPFVGRLDDISEEGMDMVRELAAIIEIHGLDAEIIVASTRTPRHVIDGALAGAGVATLPFKVFQQMVRHPLTDSGIASFKADWARAQEELAAKS